MDWCEELCACAAALAQHWVTCPCRDGGRQEGVEKLGFHDGASQHEDDVEGQVVVLEVREHCRATLGEVLVRGDRVVWGGEGLAVAADASSRDVASGRLGAEDADTMVSNQAELAGDELLAYDAEEGTSRLVSGCAHGLVRYCAMVRLTLNEAVKEAALCYAGERRLLALPRRACSLVGEDELVTVIEVVGDRRVEVFRLIFHLLEGSQLLRQLSIPDGGGAIVGAKPCLPISVRVPA